MRYSRFIFWDGLAALISAPVVVLLGFKFGDEVELIIQKVRHGQVGVIVAILVVVAAYLAYKRVRSNRLKAQAAKKLQAELSDPGTSTAPSLQPSKQDKAAV